MFLRFKLLAVGSTFKRLDRGFAFYPYGALGRGYLIDEAQRVALEARLNRFYNWAVPLVALLVLASLPVGLKYLPPGRLGPAVMALATMAVAGVFVFVGYWLFMRPAVAGLPTTAERRTVRDVQAARAASASYFRLSMMLAASGIAASASLFALRRGIAAGNLEAAALSGLGLGFFALMFLLNLHAVVLKIRAR